jgi:hypothetical protein
MEHTTWVNVEFLNVRADSLNGEGNFKSFKITALIVGAAELRGK